MYTELQIYNYIVYFIDPLTCTIFTITPTDYYRVGDKSTKFCNDIMFCDF